MADVVSVANAIRHAVAQIVYPTPGVSITGRNTVITRGWITNDMISACVAKNPDGTVSSSSTDFVGIIDLKDAVSFLPEALGRPWRMVSGAAPTVSVTAIGNTATISVAGTPNGAVGLAMTPDRSGMLRPGQVAAYAPTATDTPTTIAAALASAIPGATSSGPVITVPNATSVTGSSTGSATQRRVARRSQQMFQVTVWSALPSARDALGTAIDLGLSFTDFLTDASGFGFQLEGRGSTNDDGGQSDGIFARPMRYRATYDTDQVVTAPTMLFGGGTMLAGGVLTNFGNTGPISGVLTDGSGDFFVDAAGNLVGVAAPAAT